jgi:RTX calcium-binding nonapeptide repeat (4 copies)/WD40-like Beta Propeller Repeat
MTRHHARTTTRAALSLTAALAAILGSTALGPPAAAAATASQPKGISGPVTLLSTSGAGVKGNATSSAPAISTDGSTVAFTSASTNLYQFDIDSHVDVFVKDVATGAIDLASRATSGTKANGDNANVALSRDGRWVAFQSEATDLDPADTDTTPDVYVKDTLLGDLTLVSASTAGIKGDGTSGDRSIDISRNGNRVVFDSDSTNLHPAHPANGQDVYMKIVSTGKLVIVSRTSTGGVSTWGGGQEPSISDSGKKVAFESFAADMHPDDPDHVEDIYLKNVGTGDLTLVSTSTAGVKGDGTSQDPDLAGGGNKVVFTSYADNLDPADTDALPDIYAKDLRTGELTLVSTSDDGVKGNGASFFPAISGDGKRVTFASESTNLDPADTDPGTDIYVKDLTTGDISMVSASPDGVDGFPSSYHSSLSGRGALVAFDSTASNLDAGDHDSIQDIYVKQPIMCSIIGTSGDDTLTGTSGDDVICGRAGNDVIKGKGGDDVLYGEGGDDTLIGGNGADAMDGGADTDTLDYSKSAAGVTVDLSTGNGSGGEADGDVFAGIEGVVGSPFDDTLTGGAGDDRFQGLAGADTIDGGDGTDVASYELSPADVKVNLSNGIIKDGDAQGDVLWGIENLTGSAFGDTLTGEDNPNVLTGLDGDDDLSGKGGDDTLLGQGGTDTFDGGAGTDFCDAVAGETVTKCEL